MADDEKIISTQELKKLIAGKKKYTLIDVRRVDELRYGMIPTAVHLALHELDEAIELSEEMFSKRYGFAKLSTTEKIIVYCRTGSRSGIACAYLKSKGYHVSNYAGSVQAWSRIDDNVKMYGS